MKHVQDQIYAELISPGCNVGIIATEKGALLVDTPLISQQAAAINSELLAKNHLPVRFIVISHPHGDHILGTDLFGKDVLIIGSSGSRDKMLKHTGDWVRQWVKTWNWEDQAEIEEMATAHITLPEVVFDTELSLNLGGVEMQILPLPGHIAEVVGVFVPAAKVLITGDALFNDHHPFMGESNFGEWLQSFRKMKELKPELIIPGHGPVCGIEIIDKQQYYMEKMMDVRSRWNPDEGEAALPARAVEELLSFYPLHGRPESTMKERVIESIRVAGDPQY